MVVIGEDCRPPLILEPRVVVDLQSGAPGEAAIPGDREEDVPGSVAIVLPHHVDLRRTGGGGRSRPGGSTAKAGLRCQAVPASSFTRTLALHTPPSAVEDE